MEDLTKYEAGNDYVADKRRESISPEEIRKKKFEEAYAALAQAIATKAGIEDYKKLFDEKDMPAIFKFKFFQQPSFRNFVKSEIPKELLQDNLRTDLDGAALILWVAGQFQRRYPGQTDLLTKALTCTTELLNNSDDKTCRNNFADVHTEISNTFGNNSLLSRALFGLAVGVVVAGFVGLAIAGSSGVLALSVSLIMLGAFLGLFYGSKEVADKNTPLSNLDNCFDTVRNALGFRRASI